MGKLITMPSRSKETETSDPTTPLAAADQLNQEERCLTSAETTPVIDFSVWARAPRERTAAYFPTYSAVSKAMQTAMRDWAR